MPNRYVKDRARSSPSLDALSAEGERCFWRLLLAADDYGRFEADPNMLRVACFPRRGDAVKVTQMVRWYAELVAGEDPIVLTYRTGGRLYGCFRKWDDKPRAKTSRFPAPPPDPGGLPLLRAPDEQMPADAVPVPADAWRLREDAAVPGSRSRLPVPVSREGHVLADAPQVPAGSAGTAPAEPAPRSPDPGVNGGGAGRARRLADDFELSEATIRWARGKGLDDAAVDRELDAFCTHYWANGKAMLDWQMAFMSWIRKSLEWGGRRTR